MRLCVLHAGQPKTGTTSLQNFLFTNSDRLRDAGVLFPRLARKRSSESLVAWVAFQHGAALRTIAGARGARASEVHLRDLEGQMSSVDHEVLLISSEFLFAELFYRDRRHVQDWFRARGYRLATITYLRDQPDRLNAAYAQNAKTAQTSDDLAEFIRKRLSRNSERQGQVNTLDYGRLCHPSLAEWGQHDFRPFSAEVRSRGVERDFTDAVRAAAGRHGRGSGLTDEAAAALVVPGRLNESEGPILVEAGRRLAAILHEKLGTSGQFGETNAQVFRELLAAFAGEGAESGKYWGLAPRRHARLRERFRAANDQFARSVWGCAWAEIFPDRDPATLVSNDLDDTGDAAARAQAARIVQAVRQKMGLDREFRTSVRQREEEKAERLLNRALRQSREAEAAGSGRRRGRRDAAS